mmetsp:Transcript_14715/g.28843  ORF Transcript_14715/g.28843 Transcript_14715/m.28843 type:complete len:228 (-) Transcript_14715:1071-1754(-)
MTSLGMAGLAGLAGCCCCCCCLLTLFRRTLPLLLLDVVASATLRVLEGGPAVLPLRLRGLATLPRRLGTPPSLPGSTSIIDLRRSLLSTSSALYAAALSSLSASMRIAFCSSDSAALTLLECLAWKRDWFCLNTDISLVRLSLNWLFHCSSSCFLLDSSLARFFFSWVKSDTACCSSSWWACTAAKLSRISPPSVLPALAFSRLAIWTLIASYLSWAWAMSSFNLAW